MIFCARMIAELSLLTQLRFRGPVRAAEVHGQHAEQRAVTRQQRRGEDAAIAGSGGDLPVRRVGSLRFHSRKACSTRSRSAISPCNRAFSFSAASVDSCWRKPAISKASLIAVTF